jgi:type I restriction enzyme S subunit
MNEKMKNLPKGWEIKKLKEIGEVISGGTPSTTVSEYWNGNISWISPSDLTGYNEIKIRRGKKSITELGLKKSSAKLMPKGSVLFSCRAPIGYVAIADEELSTNQGFKSIIPNANIDSLFIYYFLKNSKQEAEKVASGTTFKEISLRNFSDLQIPLPPLETQQHIVSKIEELFSELEKGVEELKKSLEQLKVYRQSVLKWAFEGRFTNENVKEGEFPEGWEVKKLGEVFNFIGGGTPSKNEKAYWNGKIPWASIKDIKGEYLTQTSDFITDEGLKKSTTNLAKNGELIIATRINPGRPIITKIETTINQDLKIARPKVNIDIKFAFYFFLNRENEILKKSSGTTVLGIRLEILNDIEISFPSIEEQHQIVQEIESRLSVADKMEEQIKTSLQQAEALKQSILKKAFSGELVTGRV